jgi:hypothetical protein
MKEATKGIITIEDFCYDAVLEMVRYLYTGSCNLDPVSLHLLLRLLCLTRAGHSGNRFASP